MAWNDIVTIVFLSLGAFLALTGSLGMLRMPDFYSRLHPAGKNDSLGQLLVLVGLCFQVEHWSHGGWLVASKLVLISIFLIVTAPTATHAITKAAWLEGLRPWRRAGDPQGDFGGNVEAKEDSDV